LRILFVVHQFPPDYQTGTEILCLRTAQSFQERGHFVRVVSADPKTPASEPARTQKVDGLDVVFVPAQVKAPRAMSARLRATYVQGPAEAGMLVAAAEFRPDVIHVHHIMQFGLRSIAVLAAIAPVLITATDYYLACPYMTAVGPNGETCGGADPDGANCVAHHRRLTGHHGLPLLADKWRPGFRFLEIGRGRAEIIRDAVAAGQQATRDIGRVATRIIAGTETMRSFFIKAGMPEERVVILPHQGPPLRVPEAPVRTPLRFGFLGSYSEHKGAHIFLAALRRIPESLPFVAILRGEAAENPRYFQQLLRLAHGDARILFLDKVPNDHFGDAMGELDIVVVPSLWAENSPLVLVGALEAGRYVVASDVNGLATPLEEAGGGQLVPAGDTATLAEALVALIRDPTPVHEVRAHPTRVGTFPTYLNDLEAHYRDAVAAPAPPGETPQAEASGAA
jgi:glycosyltransferase involved in cell wall biosynthesis